MDRTMSGGGFKRFPSFGVYPFLKKFHGKSCIIEDLLFAIFGAKQKKIARGFVSIG
jgi:hypothetical protein